MAVLSASRSTRRSARRSGSRAPAALDVRDAPSCPPYLRSTVVRVTRTRLLIGGALAVVIVLVAVAVARDLSRVCTAAGCSDSGGLRYPRRGVRGVGRGVAGVGAGGDLYRWRVSNGRGEHLQERGCPFRMAVSVLPRRHPRCWCRPHGDPAGDGSVRGGALRQDGHRRHADRASTQWARL